MDKPLTLVEHLNELRKRIILSLVCVGISSALSFPLTSQLLKILKRPAFGIIENLVFFSPQEAFLIYMRIAVICGLTISMPVILYQIWAFISPAVEEKFRRHVGSFVVFCSLSFATGCLFAYFILIPPALKFLLSFAGEDLEPVISATKYISFVTSLVLGCGLVFQMPMLSFFLTKLGVISSRLLRKKYKYAVIIIFIVAAIITPTPDAFNMFMLAGPMIFLYEMSIWVSFVAGRKPKVEE